MGKTATRFWIHLFTLAFLASGTVLAAQAADYGFAPVSGEMTSPFGWRVDPINGSQRFHGGIDIAASQGTPVYAPQAGVVIYSGHYGGYGNVVVIDHGKSLYTLYGHTSQMLVQPGNAVYRGQAIALVGSTGRSTGPHLHFEVHYNGQYQNPLNYLVLLNQQSGPMLAQAAPLPASYANVSGHRHATSAPSAKTTRKRYPKNAYGRKVVQLVNGNDIQNVEF